MQSSPPQRATDRAPSPTPSQYSIDLAALELDSHSGASTPLPTLQVDRVLSEEIDGPSDFTLNMEAWMKGGSLRSKGGLESLEEKPEEGDGGDGIPDTLEDMEKEITLLAEDEEPADHRTPRNSPLSQSVPDTPLAGEKDEGGDDPYILATQSTSQPAQSSHPEAQKFSLQPTVEEYYSELTPAPKHTANHNNMLEPDSPKSTNSSSFQSEAEENRVSSPTLSPARSPMLQHSTPRPGFSSLERFTLEQQLEQLHKKCLNLEEMNEKLKNTLDDERRAREEEKKSRDTKPEQSTESQLQIQQRRHGEEIDKLTHLHTTALQNVKDELAHARLEHSEELCALERKVESAHEIRDEAMEGTVHLQSELDEKIDECHGLRMEIERGEELREGIKEQLRVARMELEMEQLRARDEGKKEKDEEEEVEEEVDPINTETSPPEDNKSDPEKDDDSRDAELAALRTQLQTLHNQLLQSQAALTTAASKASTTASHFSKKYTSLQGKYNASLLSRDAAEDRLSRAQTSHSHERATLIAQRNALALDSQERARVAELVEKAAAEKIATSVRKREVYWRGRVGALEEERRKMAKALLRAWGREEIGVGFDAVGKGGEADAESGWQWYEYLFEAEKGMKKKNGEGKGKGEVDAGVEEKCVRWN